MLALISLLLNAVQSSWLIWFSLVICFCGWYRYADADLTTLFVTYRGVSTQLNNRVVWITGASSGIGEQLAYEMTAKGAQVILTARRGEELQRVANNCKGTLKPMILPLDVLQYDKHQQATKQIIDKYGRIDILILNAGRSQRALAMETTIETTKQLFELNVFSCIHLTRVVVPIMQTQRSGHIVITSSAAGKFGAPLISSYNATKHALHGYYNGLRGEVAMDNIHVTLVCPGPVATPIIENAFKGDGSFVGPNAEEKEKKMTVQRCASLMLCGIANQLSEQWISPQPILFFFYISQYFPTLYFFLIRLIGPKRVAIFKAGGDPNQPFSSIPTAAASATASQLKKKD